MEYIGRERQGEIIEITVGISADKVKYKVKYK